VWAGMLAGLLTWLCAALLLAAVYGVARFVLDRRRAAQWDRALARLGASR
jgi:hypothetical protein